MSTSVLPLPTGSGLMAINDHRPRREAEPHAGEDGEAPAGEEGRSEPEPHRETPHREAAPPMAEDETVPAETLFAAALLANELPAHRPTPGELKLLGGQTWTPPESPLRLRDKLI